MCVAYLDRRKSIQIFTNAIMVISSCPKHEKKTVTHVRSKTVCNRYENCEKISARTLAHEFRRTPCQKYYRVLQSTTEYDGVLRSTTEYYRVLQSITEYDNQT